MALRRVRVMWSWPTTSENACGRYFRYRDWCAIVSRVRPLKSADECPRRQYTRVPGHERTEAPERPRRAAPAPGHPPVTAYGCCLPALTRFTVLRRPRPGATRRRIARIALERGFSIPVSRRARKRDERASRPSRTTLRGGRHHAPVERRVHGRHGAPGTVREHRRQRGAQPLCPAAVGRRTARDPL